MVDLSGIDGETRRRFVGGEVVSSAFPDDPCDFINPFRPAETFFFGRPLFLLAGGEDATSSSDP